MFNLTVVFGPTNQNWMFMFKDRKSAEQTEAVLKSPSPLSFTTNPITGADVAIPVPTQIIHIEDDFGSTATFQADQIHGFMFEDMDKSGEAAIERALNGARMQAKAQTKAQSDAVLKFAQMTGPMMGNSHRG